MQFVIAFIYGSASYYVCRFFPLTIFLLSLLCLALSVRQNLDNQRNSIRHGLTPVYVIVLMSLLGFCSAYFRSLPSEDLSAIAGRTILVEGKARSEAVPLYSRPGSFSNSMDITDAADTAGRILELKEMRVIGPCAMTPGMMYRITAHVPADAYFMNPGSRAGLSVFAEVIEPLDSSYGSAAACPTGFFQESRRRLNAAFKKWLSPAASSFVMALITGERGLISKETNNAFNVTGLAHLLHKAGLHFGLLFFFLFGTTRFLVKTLPDKLFTRLTLYASPSQIAAIISLPFMVWYLGISSPDFGTARAFIMVCFFLFGLLVQRRGLWLNSLMLAVFIIVIWRPDSLTELSFQMSVAAVLCIGHAVGGKQEQKGASIISYIRSSLLITLAASAGTAPLIIYYFHIFSVISPITNLIVIPAVGFVILPLAFISSFIILLFDVFPFHSILDLVVNHVISFVHYVGQWEFAALRIPAFPPALIIFFYTGLCMFTAIVYSRSKENARSTASGNGHSQAPRAFISNVRSLLLPCAVALLPTVIYLIVATLARPMLSVTFLDVGQGDGAVIELPDRRTIVMDTGSTGFQVEEFLRYRGTNEIEAVMLSHGHHDHTGGLEHIVNDFKVRAIWDNDRLIHSANIMARVPHRGLQRGDIIRGRGFTITVLHPYEGFYCAGTNKSEENSEENNDSLIVRIQGDAASFLFTGDVEREAEDDAAHTGPALKSTVLKVAHHGSRSSSTEEFMSAVSPDIAVISSGRKNRFGHPHEETLARLSGCRVFRTDRDGAIRISEGENGMVLVKTWKKFRMTEAHDSGDEWMNINRLFWGW
ncbi:MAG: DNA internalization-related competence protein ComEC/Rec2 [Nitrospirae bacterium]|nr:DNA internalization-related competence protein ComEC/Rec2 [Nitrospirota bacterium]